uniref:Uncharacterized protein n=1 Tax=Arundo donax TaxID=35708 RepID=A0A0A9FCZ7_ARUDO
MDFSSSYLDLLHLFWLLLLGGYIVWTVVLQSQYMILSTMSLEYWYS